MQRQRQHTPKNRTILPRRSELTLCAKNCRKLACAAAPSISQLSSSRRRASRPVNLNFLSHLYCHQILAQFQWARVSLSRRRD
jgi:hypothetical protein